MIPYFVSYVIFCSYAKSFSSLGVFSIYQSPDTISLEGVAWGVQNCLQRPPLIVITKNIPANQKIIRFDSVDRFPPSRSLFSWIMWSFCLLKSTE